jgi:FKBP-type peptidyl-prolyl cis-trans isomerase SlpA
MSERKVLVHMVVRLPDGTELENSRQRGRPVLMTLGDGSLSPELEQHLEGASVGERMRFTLPGESLFGPYRPDLVQFMERHQFPSHAELTEGQVIAFQDARGQELPGVVNRVQGQSVEVDFNVPFIKALLSFDIEVLEWEPTMSRPASQTIPIRLHEDDA